MRLRLDVLRLRLDGGRTSLPDASDDSSLRGLSSCDDDSDDAGISLRDTQTTWNAPTASVCTVAVLQRSPQRLPDALGGWGQQPSLHLAAAPALDP